MKAIDGKLRFQCPEGLVPFSNLNLSKRANELIDAFKRFQCPEGLVPFSNCRDFGSSIFSRFHGFNAPKGWYRFLTDEAEEVVLTEKVIVSMPRRAGTVF